MPDRTTHPVRFYELLGRLSDRVGGPRRLQECNGRMDWPCRGVYFFFEHGELRSVTGSGPRVVRIGTHGLKTGSKSKLWGRLSQHRGKARTSGGNHRGSIFRLVVGIALAKRDKVPLPKSWGIGGSVKEAARRLNVDKAEIYKAEAYTEASVSAYIGRMPFLWLNVNDAPGPESARGLIERNAIALLSGYDRSGCDTPSTNWLGHHSDREKIRKSGIWNNNHVGETYDLSFLNVMESCIDATTTRGASQ